MPVRQSIHASFPYFIRAAYIWLLIAAFLECFAVPFHQNGGFTGASRHALTVASSAPWCSRSAAASILRHAFLI